MGALIAAIFGLAIVGGMILGFLRFDAMLRHIYETDKDRWLALGSPIGFFWSPKDKSSFFQATNARNALFFSFLAAGLKEPK
jgi:hypothetical protein